MSTPYQDSNLYPKAIQNESDVDLDRIVAEQLRHMTPEESKSTTIISKLSTLRNNAETLVEDADIDHTPLPPVGAFLGRCRIQTILATTSSSQIYRGRLHDLGIDVAIKVIHTKCASNRPTLIAHLKNEFEILKLLRHDGVCRLWDYRDVQFDEKTKEIIQPHLATEYVESISLERLRIEQGGRINLLLATRIGNHLINAMFPAWQQSIIHRDLKPENILFTPSGHVRIIDWGMAGMEGSELSLSNSSDVVQLLGSPAFAAPETLRTVRSFNQATDIYGIASTLYLLITGQLPYSNSDPYRMALKKLTRLPKPPCDLIHDPGILRFSDLLMRMMEINPIHRLQDANEILDEFKKIHEEIRNSRR